MTLDATTFKPTNVTAEQNNSNTAFRAGVNWKPTDNTLLYVSITKGYKPGSFITNPNVLSSQISGVRQESVMVYEAGAKVSLPSARLSLDGSVFHYDYTDKQTGGRVFLPPFGNLPALVNVPSSRINGAELNVNWRPASGLKLSGSVVYTDSKVNQDFVTPDPLGVAVNIRGEQLPASTKWQALGDAEYRFPIGGAISAYFGGSVTYHSRSNAQFGDNPEFALPSYTLLDVRAGVTSADGKYGLEFFGRNVTNKYYWTSVSVSGDVIGRYAAMPVTYGLRAHVQFPLTTPRGQEITMKLAGKRAAIIGGGGGIGRSIALALAREGVDILVGDVDGAAAAAVAAEVEAIGRRGHDASCDLGDDRSVADFADVAFDRLGRVDLLFNHAGASVAGLLEQIGSDDWSWILNINITGLGRSIREFLPRMTTQGGGHIVNTSSGLGLFQSLALAAPYSATKAAIIAYSRSLAVYARNRGIGVTVFCPDITRTAFVASGRLIGLPPALVAGMLPSGHMQTPDEAPTVCCAGWRTATSWFRPCPTPTRSSRRRPRAAWRPVLRSAWRAGRASPSSSMARSRFQRSIATTR